MNKNAKVMENKKPKLGQLCRQDSSHTSKEKWLIFGKKIYHYSYLRLITVSQDTEVN